MTRAAPRALLLDFGGTLAIERPSRGAIYAEAAVRAGLAMDADQMTERMRTAHRALPIVVDGAFRYTRPWFRRFIRTIFVDHAGLDTAALPGVEAELFKRFADPTTFELREGVHGLLRSARELGLRTALVSNWSDALVPLVHRLGLQFDAVISSADVRSEKPDAAIFRAALGELGVEPQSALHAGDSIQSDVVGAASLGITPVWVDHAKRGPNASVMQDPATHPSSRRVTSLAELSSVLHTWATDHGTTP